MAKNTVFHAKYNINPACKKQRSPDTIHVYNMYIIIMYSKTQKSKMYYYKYQ